MRNTWKVALAGCLVLAGVPARADDQADMRKLLDQAIQAVGGETKLIKYKAETMKFKGKVYIGGGEAAFTAEWSAQYPQQEKISVAGDNFTIDFVVNKDKGWVKESGQTREMTKEQLTEQKKLMYARWLTRVVMLKEKGFTLSPIGEVKVGKHSAMGIKVSHKDRPDVDLYFDTKTHLLLKSEVTIKIMETGKEAIQETTYREYKDADGIKYPSKMSIKRDGQKYVEVEQVTDFRPQEKLDDSVFDKP